MRRSTWYAFMNCFKLLARRTYLVLDNSLQLHNRAARKEWADNVPPDLSGCWVGQPEGRLSYIKSCVIVAARI